MSAFGPSADWLCNIEAIPNPEVIFGSQRFTAVHRVLDEEEAISVITRYEQRHWLIAPAIRWVLSYFLGWQYNGAMADRRRLVAQLPFIAFRPRWCRQASRGARVLSVRAARLPYTLPRAGSDVSA